MATTQVLYGVDQLKGPNQYGDLHCYRVTVAVTGTYLTATKPTFNVLTALQQAHEGATAVVVQKVIAFQDYNDGTNVYTANNAQIALSNVNANCTGDKVVFRVDSGATDGGAGAEIADATALNGYFQFIVICSVTGA